MTLAGVDLPGVALVVTAVGPTLAVILTWLEQRRAASKKEEIAQQERIAARKSANASLEAIRASQGTLIDKQDQVHTIVNSQREAMLALIEKLKTEIARLKAEIARLHKLRKR